MPRTPCNLHNPSLQPSQHNPALRSELHNQIPRVKAGNYTLNGIVGIELSFKTYGVVGTGNIGIEASNGRRGGRAWTSSSSIEF